MGQYYNIAFKSDSDNKIRFNDRKVAGVDYTMAKLMEHSYFRVPLMDSIASVLEKSPTKLVWVGDYATDEEIKTITTDEIGYDDIWEDEHDDVLDSVRFDYSGKVLVNYDKKQWISLDKCVSSKDGINPISILTCIGNGRGGGDYSGSCMEHVGTWAWDRIGITSSVPEGFTELQVKFEEEW